MPRGPYKPNQDLLILLAEAGQEPVEVTQIRDEFENRYQTGMQKSERRRWVQGQFRTLEKHGYIVERDTNVAPKKYDITEKVQAYLSGSSHECSLKNSGMEDIAASIRNRMAEIKVALIESRAEANVYEELSQHYPSLKNHLLKKFSETKEKQISLSGQLTAIEYALQTAEQHL